MYSHNYVAMHKLLNLKHNNINIHFNDCLAIIICKHALYN